MSGSSSSWSQRCVIRLSVASRRVFCWFGVFSRFENFALTISHAPSPESNPYSPYPLPTWMFTTHSTIMIDIRMIESQKKINFLLVDIKLLQNYFNIVIFGMLPSTRKNFLVYFGFIKIFHLVIPTFLEKSCPDFFFAPSSFPHFYKAIYKTFF